MNLISSRGLSHCSGKVSKQVSNGLVSDRIDAHVAEFLLQSRVPVVLDVVVRSPWHLCSDERPPADDPGNLLNN